MLSDGLPNSVALRRRLRLLLLARTLSTVCAALFGNDATGRAVFLLPEEAARPPGPARVMVLQSMPSGASAEGNISVLVVGTAFRDFGDVRCRFGTAEVPGTVHNSRAIVCVAPPFTEAAAASRPQDVARALPVRAALQVSLNGVDFHGAQIPLGFWYYNLSSIAIGAVHPSGGPPAGGTTINITGAGFLDYYGGGVAGPACVFGGTAVAATLLDPWHARCVTPPLPPDQVSSNGLGRASGNCGIASSSMQAGMVGAGIFHSRAWHKGGRRLSAPNDA